MNVIYKHYKGGLYAVVMYAKLIARNNIGYEQRTDIGKATYSGNGSDDGNIVKLYLEHNTDKVTAVILDSKDTTIAEGSVAYIYCCLNTGTLYCRALSEFIGDVSTGIPRFKRLHGKDFLAENVSRYMERELEENYPLYAGYWYVADDTPVQCNEIGMDAGAYKQAHGVLKLTSCDILGRGLPAL